MGTNLNNRLLPWKVCIDEMVFTSLMNCEFGDLFMPLLRIHQLNIFELYMTQLAECTEVDFSGATAKHGTRSFGEFNTDSCHIFWYVLDTRGGYPSDHLIQMAPWYNQDVANRDTQDFWLKARKQYVTKTIIIDHNIINECVELCVHCCLKLWYWHRLNYCNYAFSRYSSHMILIIYECISGSYI